MALILHPDYQLYERKEKPFCSSLQVAQEFEKRHDTVLRDVRLLDCSENFRLLNFVESSYRNEQNKRQPMFYMTKDGFIFLVMGYRGKKAAAIKEAYIRRFNDMEKYIKNYLQAREDFAPFTQAIMDSHETPKSYHYTNEINMINRIVLGMDAKKFRELHGLQDGQSIRPYLNNRQLKAVRTLQIEDIRLLYRGCPYEDRKNSLTDRYTQNIKVLEA